MFNNHLSDMPSTILFQNSDNFNLKQFSSIIKYILHQLGTLLYKKISFKKCIKYQTKLFSFKYITFASQQFLV